MKTIIIPNLIFISTCTHREQFASILFSPLSFCPRCQRANLRLGEFQCFILSLLKTTRAKLTRAKITQGESNPVYSINVFTHDRDPSVSFWNLRHGLGGPRRVVGRCVCIWCKGPSHGLCLFEC